MTKPIAGFFKEYRFLSNFWPATIIRTVTDVTGDVGDTIEYSSVEHAYQAAKTTNLKDKLWIAAAKRPGLAKMYGRKVTVRPDWEVIKVGVMESLVREKFSRNLELKNLLLATNDAELIEANTWRDTFWGRCDGVGKNHLGRILMKIREELNETS